MWFLVSLADCLDESHAIIWFALLLFYGMASGSLLVVIFPSIVPPSHKNYAWSLICRFVFIWDCLAEAVVHWCQAGFGKSFNCSGSHKHKAVWDFLASQFVSQSYSQSQWDNIAKQPKVCLICTILLSCYHQSCWISIHKRMGFGKSALLVSEKLCEWGPPWLRNVFLIY